MPRHENPDSITRRYRQHLLDLVVRRRRGQQTLDDLLDVEDVLGKRIISTRLRGNVTIRPDHATAALEVMSRFAADPRWLIYLPPTRSPCETSQEPGLLEHPAQAFAYFRAQGIEEVICEEKHMGSRAVLVVCRDETVARERFGITSGEFGIVLTRTGRRFFPEPAIERQVLDRLRTAIAAAGLWESLNTSWVCLDCELMPWSAKAQEQLNTQYAAVGSAAGASPATSATNRARASRSIRSPGVSSGSKRSPTSRCAASRVRETR